MLLRAQPVQSESLLTRALSGPACLRSAQKARKMLHKEAAARQQAEDDESPDALPWLMSMLGKSRAKRAPCDDGSACAVRRRHGRCCTRRQLRGNEQRMMRTRMLRTACLSPSWNSRSRAGAIGSGEAIKLALHLSPHVLCSHSEAYTNSLHRCFATASVHSGLSLPPAAQAGLGELFQASCSASDSHEDHHICTAS